MCIYNGWWLSLPVKNKQICETGNLPQTWWTCVYIAYIPYNVCPCMYMVQHDLKAGGFIQESTIWWTRNQRSCLTFKTKPSGPPIIYTCTTLHHISFHYMRLHTYTQFHKHTYIYMIQYITFFENININACYCAFMGYPKWSKQDHFTWIDSTSWNKDTQ